MRIREQAFVWEKCNNCLSGHFPQKKFWSKSFRSFVKKCPLGVQILIVVFLSTQAGAFRIERKNEHHTTFI